MKVKELWDGIIKDYPERLDVFLNDERPDELSFSHAEMDSIIDKYSDYEVDFFEIWFYCKGVVIQITKESTDKILDGDEYEEMIREVKK